MLKKSVLAAAFATTLAVSHNAAATIVLVETNMGDFEINLFDQTTPKTVTNFLTYVKDGSYNNSIFHRSLKDFVVQGGGMRYSGNNASPFTEVPARGPIDNEPKLSNVRGTVAMAKKAQPKQCNYSLVCECQKITPATWTKITVVLRCLVL